VNKENLLNYLQITDFWEEIFKMNEEDLFVSFPQLSVQDKFNEPFSLVEFNENLIKKKIFERNLTNVDYQQYLCFHILRSCKYLRDFKKLNKALVRIFSEFSHLSTYFRSNYHFNFWAYVYCIILITFLRSLKSNFYHSLDEEMNITNQVYVYHQAKKFLKTFSVLIGQDIPSIHQFDSSLNRLEKEPFVERKRSLEQMLPNDEDFIKFIDDLKNGPFSERFKTIIDNKTSLFEDYLKILNILEELNNMKHHPKLAVKMQLEKIPILLKLNQLDSIRSILNDCLRTLKKDKWDHIYNFYSMIFIILLGFLEKNEENINLIFEYLNIETKYSQFGGNCIQIYSEKFIYEYVSNYLNSNDFKQNKINLRNVNFDLAKLLDLKLNEEQFKNQELEATFSNSYHNYKKRVELSLSDMKSIELCFMNRTKLNLLVESVKLFFEDEISNDKIMFDTTIEKFILGNGQTCKSFLFVAKKYDKDMILRLNNILVRLYCGVEALYKMNDYNFVINVKTSNLRFNYVFVNHDSDCKFFTNTVYSGYFVFSNVHQSETLMIELNQDISSSNNLKILNKYEIHLIDENNNVNERIKYIEENSENLDVRYDSKKYETFISIEEKSITIKNTGLERFILKFYFILFDSLKNVNNLSQIPLILSFHKDNKNHILFRELINFKLSNLFDIQNRFKSIEESILVQTSIKLNFENENTDIHLSEEEVHHLETGKNINFIKSFRDINSNDLSIIPYFTYKFKSRLFSYHISRTDFDQYLSNIKELNYLVKVKTSIDKTIQDGVQIFKEMKIFVDLEKYTDLDSIIMIKIKENINWNIIGKSRVLERLSEKCKKMITFNVIPFTDGFVKLPEINIQEYILNKADKINTEMTSDNTLEFSPLSNSIIENNQKIIKVYPISNFQMKLNII